MLTIPVISIVFNFNTQVIGLSRKKPGYLMKDLTSIPGGAKIAIMYKPPSHELYSSGFRIEVNELYHDIVYDKEYERYGIEEPRFMLIDGNETGTFVFTHKDKYDENAITWEAQIWLVDNPDHFYEIFFLVRTDPVAAFYGHSNVTPENIEIRDKFIKSIKFL